MDDIQLVYDTAVARMDVSWEDLISQANVRRALDVALAGGHSILIVSSPAGDGVLFGAWALGFANRRLPDGPGTFRVRVAPPCECGWYGDTHIACLCEAEAVERYRRCLNGPIRKYDIVIEAPRLADYEIEAWLAQRPNHYYTEDDVMSMIVSAPVYTDIDLDGPSLDLIRLAVHELLLDAQALRSVLRVARTIANLDNSEQIRSPHVAEAIQYARGVA